jgi:hypothetical protein
MRWILLLAVPMLATGCTQRLLTSSTLGAARSVADLQTQQVLDNLALIACRPDASPSQINISSGLVQVTDQANGTLVANFFPYSLASNNILSPSLSAQCGLVAQWSVSPVTDGGQLDTLRLSYRKALDPANPEIDDSILQQIVALCVRYTLLPKEETIRRILGAGDARNKAGYLRESLEDESRQLRERISELARLRERALQKNDIRTANQVERERRDLAARADLKERQGELLRSLAGPKKSEAYKKSPLRHARTSRSSLVPSDASDTPLLILTALAAKSPQGYLPEAELIWETNRNPALVDQAEDQIAALEDLLEIRTPFVWRGSRSDVPRCACLAGYLSGAERSARSG